MRYIDFKKFLNSKARLKSIGRLSKNDEDLSLIQQTINLNDSAESLSREIRSYTEGVEQAKNALQQSEIDCNKSLRFINSQIDLAISEYQYEYALNYEEVKSKHEKGEVLSKNESRMLDSIESLVSELEVKTLAYKESRQKLEKYIKYYNQNFLDYLSPQYSENQKKLNQIKSIKNNFSDEERAILQEYETQYQKMVESKVSSNVALNRPKIMNDDESILKMALKEDIIPIMNVKLNSNSTGKTVTSEGKGGEKCLDLRQFTSLSDNNIYLKGLLKEGVWHKAIVKDTGHAEPIILQLQKDGRILAVSPIIGSYLLFSKKLIDVIKPSGEHKLQADTRNCGTISLNCLVNLDLKTGFIINGERGKSIDDVVEAGNNEGTWTTEELLKVTQNSKYFKSCGINPNTFTVTNSEGTEVTLKEYRDKWKALSIDKEHNMRLDFSSYREPRARRNSEELIDEVLVQALGVNNINDVDADKGGHRR
jgi:hypothetical protein